MYDNCKIRGPYAKTDGHGNVRSLEMRIFHPDGRIQYLSAARYVMEQKLGRYLTKDEVVCQIDGDVTNISENNLKITPNGYSLTDTIIECDGIYKGWKITGKPIINKNRNHSDSARVTISMRDPNGNKVEKSYPTYLMEMHLGRFLLPNETIDHIDHDTLNNDISNLRVIDKHDHNVDDTIIHKPQTFVCPNCGKEFTPTGKQMQSIVRYRRKCEKNGKVPTGPFCSRKCSSNAQSKIHSGEIQPNPDIKFEYTTRKIERMGIDSEASKDFLASIDKKRKTWDKRRDDYKQYKREQNIKLKKRRAKILKNIHLIRTSNIDFNQCGWIRRVSELTGLNERYVREWVKLHMPKLYKSCYKRDY